METVTLIDDLDGSTAIETVSFGIDGVSFEIDLSESNAAKLRKALAPFIAAGHDVPRPNRRYPTGGESRLSSRDRRRNRKMREWARQQGKIVSDRGRLPATVLVEYTKAHVK